MSSTYWIKLYTEILNDPKMARMPDHLWRRTVEIFLLAGKTCLDGELPPVADIAWELRASEADILECLGELQMVGIVAEVERGRWAVSQFAKRQSPSPLRERVARYRERKRNEANIAVSNETSNDDVTNRYDECNASKLPDTDTESEQNHLSRAASAPGEEFDEMRGMVERLTGFPISPGDVETINEFIRQGVIEDDISRALAWWRSEGKIAHGARALAKSVRVEVGKRIQTQTAANAPPDIPLNGNGNYRKSTKRRGNPTYDPINAATPEESAAAFGRAPKDRQKDFWGPDAETVQG